jgi:hypothetical protein
MQFQNPLPGDRSSLTLVKHRDKCATSPAYSADEVGATRAEPSAVFRPHARSYHRIDRPLTEDWRATDDPSLLTPSRQHGSWRVIPAVVSGLMTRTIGGFAACVAVEFPNFLLVVMSWMVAQAISGCAAYAEAMHSGSVYPGEPMDHRDPANGAPSRHENPERLGKSGPSEMSAIAKGEIGECGPILQPDQTRSGVAAAVEAENILRSEATPAASLDRNAPVTSLVAGFRSRICRGRDQRLSIMEAFDDQTLRDVGISRCEIEYLARHGERRE